MDLLQVCENLERLVRKLRYLGVGRHVRHYGTILLWGLVFGHQRLYHRAALHPPARTELRVGLLRS